MIKSNVLEKKDALIKIQYKCLSTGKADFLILQRVLGLSNSQKNNRKIWMKRAKSANMVNPVKITNKKLQLLK